MLQLIRTAAFAATLAFAPATASAPALAPAANAHSHAGSAPPVDEAGYAPRASQAALAPGQSEAEYHAWLARAPAHRQAVQAFRDHLAAEGLDRVVPVWQLIRTSSSWRQCAAEPFEVAPPAKWDHITATLRFVRDEIVPVLGAVEAVSGYRNEALNACSDGAAQSAHRHFFALDLAPVSAEVTRAAMIRGICAAHQRDGRAYDAGLGFYSGLRFHVDSNGFRKWGPDGRGATSPCATRAYA